MISPELGRLDPEHVIAAHVTQVFSFPSGDPTTLSLGVASFAGDFSGVRRFAERDHKNLAQRNMHPEPGGHYAAHLEPEILADDIRSFDTRYW